VSAQLGLYIAVAALAVAGGLGTVLARNVVYASLSLLLCLLAVAGVYVLIFSPFLAMVQVLIYGGAIIVVVLFALMLTRQAADAGRLDNRQKPLAAVVGLGALGVMLAVIIVNAWPETVEPEPVGFRELGRTLFDTWAVPFEIASVLLLVALIGALVIARSGDRK
jgi:NADH-quinone oxidoreductase subunit J/NAD(P)H-quinone oxidoreductase subunit 6